MEQTIAQSQSQVSQLLTLARMQSTLRHRRIQHLSFLQASTIQFPPIASVILAFPPAQPQRNQVKNSPRRRRMQELEKYIQRHGERVSREEASRIIYASPLSKRIIFQKTLRGNLYSTLDHKTAKNKNFLPSSTKSQKQKNNLSIAPAKIMQQSQGFKQFKSKLLTELGTKAIRVDTRYGSLASNNNPQLMLTSSQNKEKIAAKQKKQHLTRIRIKNIHLQPERYSPWRSQQLEDELVL